MTPSNSVAVKTLVEFLKANLPGVDIVEEWPDSKKAMKMPCISVVTVGNAKLSNAMPIIHKKIAEDDTIEGYKRKLVVYIIGYMDIKIQMDLWANYKAERSELYERVMAVLDRQFIDSGYPTGLSLELVDYHNCFARYDQTGYAYMDSGEASQRQEWRAKIDLEVNYPRLVEKVESIMEEITLDNLVNETADVENDETDETLTIE